MCDKDKIIKKVFQIHQAISSINNNFHGLHGGRTGLVLFLVQFENMFNKKVSYDKITLLLNEEIKSLNAVNDYTFCNGLSGFCWTIDLLSKKKKVKFKKEVISKKIENYLIENSKIDLVSNNFDFLHGGLGSTLYFLRNYKNSSSVYFLNKVIEILNYNSIKEGKKRKWASLNFVSDKSPGEEYNLGLSHGIPSIIVILTKILEKNISSILCKQLIEESVCWLLEQKNENYEGSLFPSHVLNGETRSETSRLGWCYGDLGIGISIWQAGKVLKNQKLMKEAIDIITHTTKRKNLESNGIYDAGLCHGTAGIAHIYGRFYLETNIPLFQSTASFWLKKTLDMARFEDGIAGYKTWDNKNKTFKIEMGLLDGIAGIGLALLSALSKKEKHYNWDECLLLS